MLILRFETLACQNYMGTTHKSLALEHRRNEPMLGEDTPPLRMFKSNMAEAPNELGLQKLVVSIITSSKNKKLPLGEMVTQ